MALLAGAGSLVAEFYAYLFLGAATGVIAMCAWAPEWWAFTYLALLPLLPVCAAWVGPPHSPGLPGER